jgi:hypothetical protein
MPAGLARVPIPQALPRPKCRWPSSTRARQEKLARDLARSAERSFVPVLSF